MPAHSEIVVEAKNIIKSFKIPLEGSNGLKQKIINTIKGRKGYREFTPLNDISFEVQKGDFFGIVGKNGSGKSTLLKTLAGIYEPISGSVKVNGSLVPFIELGVGFNPELTGRENVYLNGALLGFSRKEIDAMYKSIVDFSELKDFMEERLKNYSSGMQVRLAFSIAIQAKGDILLLDEVLAVGDAAFQQKCFDYFAKLKRQKKTIIIVTHDMTAVKRFCNRAMIIKDGVIEKIGTPNEVADLYTEENIEAINQVEDEEPEYRTNLKLSINKKRFLSSDIIEAKVQYDTIKGVACYLNISLVKNGIVLADLNTREDSALNPTKGIAELIFSQSLEKFNAGTYDLYISVHRLSDDHLLEHIPRAASFFIEGRDASRDGAVKLDDGWRTIS